MEVSSKLLKTLRSQISDPSPEKRLGALKALEHLVTDSSSESSAASFVAALTDLDVSVREFAAQVLERHPSRSAVPALAKALDDPVASVRKHALLALFATDKDAALDMSKSKVRDESADVRRVVVRVLAGFRNREVLSLLVRMLDDPELLVSRPAVEALAKMGQDALDPLLKFVQSRLPDVPDAGWDALRQIDAERAREIVLHVLSDSSLEQSARIQLLSKLTAVATSDDAPLLVQALSEFRPGHQLGLTRAVGRLKVHEAVPWLISWFDHPEPSASWWAADALAKIGDASCVPAIAAKLEAVLDTRNGAKTSTETVAVALKLAVVISELGAKEYSGLVLKTVVTFKTGSEYLAPIATAVEIKRMAKLLTGKDDDLAILAARFFFALSDRGEESRDLVREAGATVSLNRAAKSDRPSVRNIATTVLRRFSEMGV